MTITYFPFLQEDRKLSLWEKIFYKIIFPFRLKRAASITTPFQCIKNQLMALYNIAPEKIAIVPPIADKTFVPISLDEQESIKEKYTTGCAYFIFYGNMHQHNNITGLLKAFSIFKKWQRSNMKLLLMGDVPHKNYDEVIHKLSSYKFKEDVIFTSIPADKKEVPKILGTAYALLSLALHDNDITPIVNALACHVPVIASYFPPIQEIAQHRALYADPKNIQSIADQMILLYKDEALHERMSMVIGQ